MGAVTLCVSFSQDQSPVLALVPFLKIVVSYVLLGCLVIYSERAIPIAVNPSITYERTS